MPRAETAAHGVSRDEPARGPHFWALTLGSLGVVYGDIGTSPLYAFREAATAAQGSEAPPREAVIGVLSLILWALTLIVTLKYVFVLLRADNDGEGGTFALMALGRRAAQRSAPLLLGLGIAGAAFFYGDAVITPAISVLSAVEGLKLVAPAFERFVIPIALLIIIGLFVVQSYGTARVASLFGPMTLVWFLALAWGGLAHIIDDPGVFLALNPLYGIAFAASHGLVGLTVLGLIFLAVTGAEALYADLGHFGRRPIQTAWLWTVFPALALNYLGQGALVLAQPEAIENPFYLLYPEWALVPMVVLATVATVIASQAVITGAYSLTSQAVELGLLPRFAVKHTSEAVSGQIYMPRVNWMLLVAVIFVVLMFKTSSALASAYGVAVTACMVITSCLAIFVLWKCWNWPLWRALALMVPLLLIEQAFFAANILKVVEGGWVPLVIASAVGLLMWTWVRGARVLATQVRRTETDLAWLVGKLEAKPPARVPGTAVFLTADPKAAPTSLMHNLKHNRVLHERNIILSIRHEDVPRVPRHERVVVDRTSETFTRVIARYGFMETPSVPKILDHCRRKELNIDMGATSFFVSRRTLRRARGKGLPGWQEPIFIAMARSSQDATAYYRIPTDRVVEIGTQVGI
jgi:KUP system potassium uptake protein